MDARDTARVAGKTEDLSPPVVADCELNEFGETVTYAYPPESAERSPAERR